MENPNERPVRLVMDIGEMFVLARLLRQAVPMLKRPEDYGRERRRALADMICLALEARDSNLPEGEEELCRRCGGYLLDGCHCDNSGYPPPDWEPETPEPPMVEWTKPELDRYLTLVERLADSIRDDRQN